MAFSTSSFTIDAGRSTTSPAAIWLAMSAGSRLILPTLHPAAARQPCGRGQQACKAMIERVRVIREADQPVAHVAEAERHFGAEVDDFVADEAIEGFALAGQTLREREHI